MKNNIMKMIPVKWELISLESYIALIKKLPNEKSFDQSEEDYRIEMLEIFFEHFTGLSMFDANLSGLDLIKITNKLNEFQEIPKASEFNKYDIKKPTELSYNEYINFQKLNENPINNLEQILKIFIKDEDVKVRELNMLDAITVFFFVQKSLKKLILTSQISLIWKMIKMKVKTFLRIKKR